MANGQDKNAKAAAKALKSETRKKKKARQRAQQRAIDEAHKRKQEKLISYDAEGNRIGDDGLPMTPARKRLHTLYNFLFVYMIITLLVAVGCIIWSFFQNQQITDWELVWYGGNTFNGYSMGTLLRVEALYLLFSCAMSLLLNIKGMAWMYDGGNWKPVNNFAYFFGVVSVVLFAAALFTVKIVEPFSVVGVVVAVLVLRFSRQVFAEFSTLEPVPVARTEVKK